MGSVVKWLDVRAAFQKDSFGWGRKAVLAGDVLGLPSQTFWNAAWVAL
ncbi:MAG: hypothetical protein ABGX16_00865 [Pirellulales bacterium]